MAYLFAERIPVNTESGRLHRSTRRRSILSPGPAAPGDMFDLVHGLLNIKVRGTRIELCYTGWVHTDIMEKRRQRKPSGMSEVSAGRKCGNKSLQGG